MLITKVKKVTQSQPRWHPPHNKKIVQHIRTPHVLVTIIKHKYCINSREVRAKFAKNPRTVVGWVVRAFARNRAKFEQSAQNFRGMFRTVVGPGVIYKG